MQRDNRLNCLILLAIIAGVVFFALYYSDTSLSTCPPCPTNDQREPSKEDTPCPTMECPTPPCKCPDCPEPTGKETDDPCPQPPPPPTIAHPCPVPEPCPEEPPITPTDAREIHRWKGDRITNGPAPWKERCVWKNVAWGNEFQFSMCLRGYSDIVSDAIKSGGRWGDCDILVSMWKQTARAALNIRENDEEGIFVDAGANIGACTLLMAAAGHTTIGFEPLKANLFYLTSGILSNERNVRDKIVLYQLGLGTHTHDESAFAASGNAGNTQLGSMVKDWPSQTFQEETAIPIMSLDEILWPDSSLPAPHVRLMKMDVQGYEVKILKGAKRLLEAGAIGIIKSELTHMFLQGQGTSAQEMLTIMMDHGYVLTGESSDEEIVGPVYEGEVVFRYKGK